MHAFKPFLFKKKVSVPFLSQSFPDVCINKLVILSNTTSSRDLAETPYYL